MKSTYGIIPQFTRFIVCRIDHDGRKWYAAGYYSGEYTWTRDYLYAREYTKATANRHVARLIDQDLTSAHYTAPIVHF